jgi:DNA invertase Pin-like site-specific DNA recombinase
LRQEHLVLLPLSLLVPVAFVSLSENVDTTTPTGKMIFTVLGAVAELERSLIVERVKAGLRNARAKGKRLGRPRTVVDASRIAVLRARGLGWKKIAGELGIGVGPACRRWFQNSGTGYLNSRINPLIKYGFAS